MQPFAMTYEKDQFMLPLSEIPAFLGWCYLSTNPNKTECHASLVKFCENSTSCYSWVQKPASINSCYPCNSSITFSVSCYLCLKLSDKLGHATSTHYSIKPKGSCYPSQWLTSHDLNEKKIVHATS